MDDLTVLRTPWGDMTVSVVAVIDERTRWSVVGMDSRMSAYEDGRGALRVKINTFPRHNRGIAAESMVKIPQPTEEKPVRCPAPHDTKYAKDMGAIVAWLLWPAIREVDAYMAQLQMGDDRKMRLNPKAVLADAEWLEVEGEIDEGLRVKSVKEEVWRKKMTR